MKRFLLAAICVLWIAASPVYAAVGDTVASCSNVTTGSTKDFQPAGAVEWSLRYVWFAKNIELQRFDGTLTAAVAQFIGPNYQYFNPPSSSTNGNYVRFKNLDAGSAVICYEGTITK